MKLAVQPLPFPGLTLLRPKRVFDARGWFSETYNRDDFLVAGIENEFIQDNESTSHARGTIRGLHFQQPPHAQAKLVRVQRGRILDVVVDLRRSSASYGKHIAVELGESEGEQLFVPTGFAHGFCTLEPDTIVFYKVDNAYSAEHDRGVFWADPSLGIEWGIGVEEAIVSDRDRNLPRLRDLPAFFD